jgi:hypothetical protein
MRFSKQWIVQFIVVQPQRALDTERDHRGGSYCCLSNANPDMKALKSSLIYGAVETFFTGGLVGEGSLWKKAIRFDVTFEKDFAVGIGYHLTGEDGYCTLNSATFTMITFQ